MSDTFTGETYNTLCKDAEDYLSKSSPEQARELLQKAISLIGTRPVARSLLADTCMTMELWSEAREQLEILITLDEGNPGNHFRLAQVLEELGEYQLAADNYQVVLDSDPKHHGASVAIKRITSRDKDTGINLADVFNAKSQEDVEETAAEEVPKGGSGEQKSVREGMQIYPDVPSDDIFAESEDDEDDDSVDALLKNIGLSGGSSSDDDEADVSRLLENIGVSTSSTLAAAFADQEEAEAAEREAASEEAVKERRRKMVSLDEIFGTSSREPEPEAEETATDEVGEIEHEEAAFGEIESEEVSSDEIEREEVS
ncbi:MAG: tetratricopeptide repeat protein, partial [Candidatus Fermentibacteraceae bacterium]|nr:tetratricopeptide repeat protein [Candidatus Fermentibacteraceae bacterium]